MPQSVIGRAGQWCFTHRWLVLVAWLIAVGGGLFATGPLFSRLSDGGLPHSVVRGPRPAAGADPPPPVDPAL